MVTVGVRVGRGRKVFVGVSRGGLPPQGGRPGSPQVGGGVGGHGNPDGSTHGWVCAAAGWIAPLWKSSTAARTTTKARMGMNFSLGELDFMEFSSLNFQSLIFYHFYPITPLNCP